MASTRIYRTAGTPTLNTKHTISMWFKRTKLTYGDCFLMDGYVDSSNRFKLAFDSSDRLELYNTHSGSYKYNVITKKVFRDTSAFYHLVIRVDTTQSTTADRVRIYVNGVQEESFESGGTDATQDDANNVVNESGATISIGDYQGGGNAFEGLMAHVHFIDGTSYAPTTFGEFDSTSGIWVPKTAPSVTYGNNGFFLKFENSSNMDVDSSGNNLSFTTSGTLTQTIDTPSNNFATLNSAPSVEIGSSAFYEYGGTNCRSSTANFIAGVSGVYLDQGKWYFEMQTATADCHIGIAGEDKIMNGGTSGGVNNRLFYYEDTTGYAYSYNGPNGQIYFSTPSDGTQTATYGNTFSSSDTIGCFADLDNNKLYFSKNGTLQNSGTGYDIEDGIYYAFGTSVYQSDTSLNFGNGTFKGVKLTGTTYSDANGEGIFKYSPNQGGAANFDSAAKNFYTLNTKNIKEFG